MALIYKLTFPNGKIYIGQTTFTLERRLAGHRTCVKAQVPKLLVHKAWKKHGEPVAQILAIVDPSELNETERRAIAAYGSFGKNGYNCTQGGEQSPMLIPEIVEKVRALAKTPARIARNIEIHLGSKRSDECRKKLSEMRKGKKGHPQSAEHRRKLAEARKNRPVVFGRKHSAETKLKMSRPKSEATKLKMSIAATGKSPTAETRAKLSLAAKNRSQEHKTKLSNARKGRPISALQREAVRRASLGRKDSQLTSARRSVASATYHAVKANRPLSLLVNNYAKNL